MWRVQSLKPRRLLVSRERVGWCASKRSHTLSAGRYARLPVAKSHRPLSALQKVYTRQHGSHGHGHALTLKVPSIHCASCVARIEKALLDLPNTEHVSVNVSQKLVYVHSVSPVKAAVYVDKLKATGYEAVPVVSLQERVNDEGDASKQLHTALIASAFAAPLMLLELPGTVQLFLCLPALYVSRDMAISAYRLGRAGSTSMDTLISLGVGASFFNGLHGLWTGMSAHCLHFDCAAVICAVINWGRYLEARATERGNRELAKVVGRQQSSGVAHVRSSDGTVSDVDISQLKVGDMVLVHPGESFPVDGVVVEGSCWADESALTGEFLPRTKTAGDSVTCGTVSVLPQHQHELRDVIVRAKHVGQDTTFAAILRQLDLLQRTKTTIQRTADTISSYFVPGVIGVAGGVFSLFALQAMPAVGLDRAISVLVGACPCALGLATPSAIAVGSGRAVQQGIIFRSPSSLELASSIKTLCFDKTGTLTETMPSVSHVLRRRDGRVVMMIDALWQLVHALASHSSHPLDRALATHLTQSRTTAFPSLRVTDFLYSPGKGMTARVEGQQVQMGSPRLADLDPH
eukprot:g47140.t1